MAERYQIKVNVSGSWANLVVCLERKLAECKMACEVLGAANRGQAAFKVYDHETGQLLEQYFTKPAAGQRYGWHAPQKP